MILAIACSGLPSSRASLGDLALLGDDVGRDLVAGEVLRPHRGDLHRGAARASRVAVVLDEDADGRRQVGGALVQVGHDRAVEVGDLAELDLLADGDREAVDDLADGGVAHGDGLERLDVAGLGARPRRRRSAGRRR